MFVYTFGQFNEILWIGSQVKYNVCTKKLSSHQLHFFVGDGWMFDLKTNEWAEIKHSNMDKPR